jgi:CTP:molybdopterin cytidylyltransferase MocA
LVTAIVMVPEGSAEASPQGWVRQARRAATADLLRQLGTVAGIERLLLVTPDTAGLALPGVELVASEPGPLHAGATLAALVREYEIERLLYIGGGAAPLLPTGALAAVVQRLQAAGRLVLSNNRFATDWAGVVPATALLPHVERLSRDNMLGWVLSTEGQLPPESLPPSTATRLDIDTPLDLQILRLHPETQPALSAYLETLPLPLGPLQQVIDVLGTPASHVFIAGRVAPDAWRALNEATRCWLRVLAEERGMVSSGRQERGEVFSLLGAYLELLGMEAFFSALQQWAGAALIDTRVLMAHQQRWPSDHDRFASDLGWAEAVQDEWLQRLTLAARAAGVPVIFGGHGLMAGALYALADLAPPPAERS